jgi:hypothetical protein
MKRLVLPLFLGGVLILLIFNFFGRAMLLLVTGQDINSINDWYKSVVGFILLVIVTAKIGPIKQVNSSRSLLFLILVFIVIGVAGFYYFKIRKVGVLTQQQAVLLLQKKAKESKLKDYWATTSCVNFQTGDIDETYISIKVYEKHGGNCLGNPNTSPQIGSFKVNKKNGRILWFNISQDTYIPFDDYVKIFSDTRRDR